LPGIEARPLTELFWIYRIIKSTSRGNIAFYGSKY